MIPGPRTVTLEWFDEQLAGNILGLVFYLIDRGVLL